MLCWRDVKVLGTVLGRLAGLARVHYCIDCLLEFLVSVDVQLT